MDATLIDSALIPEGTVLTEKGDSHAVDISATKNRCFLLTLTITEAVEQEYLEMWLFGSIDGTTWGATPMATLPQRFYAGDYSTMIDLSSDPETKFLRVHWDLSRWGRGEIKPSFACGLRLREVPQDILREAQSRRA